MTDTHASDSCSAHHSKKKGREEEKTHQLHSPPHTVQAFSFWNFSYSWLYHMPPLLTTTNISMQLLFFLLKICNIHSRWLQLSFCSTFFPNVEKNHRLRYFRQTFQNSSHFPAEVMDSLKNCNALLQNASVTTHWQMQAVSFPGLSWKGSIQLYPRDHPLLSVTANKWSINFMFPFESANRPRNP